MSSNRGSALLEVVVVGFAVVALALPALIAVLRLSEAEIRATTVATDTASWVARHGALPPADRDVAVDVRIERDTVEVRAQVPVSVLGVRLTTVEATVERSRIAPISPYRSDR